MRILVVDDDAMAGEMTGAVLEDAGHDVVMVENGIDATEALSERGPFDLVVSDMNMPLVSGIDLFRNLRDQGEGIPFILLTGDEPGPLLAEEPRLDGCLTKDFTLETSLMEAIAAALAKHGKT
ncbi:response regulator [Paramagnetospirillum marisnigri]|uniref:Response regulator n=1 Tax=Paramagnetospirillum marisnigri TaxID=1285242 RepID=A0A178MX41_9PROT|nr:response regulator [Paramagnetospirillum marisnigri]OAN53966.1 response regulator [Paramagnetospirillum marisnigri]